MIEAGTWNIRANRWTPFVETVTCEAMDLTGATLDMQIRLLPTSSGSPLVDLSPAAPGSEGLSLAVDDSGLVTTSTITIRINEATMEPLLYDPEREGDAELWYDLHVTPAGGDKYVLIRGTFTIVDGATH